MGVMRRRRLASIAAAVAMVMAVLAVCPCPAMIAAATTEDAHGCCAGKAGLTVAPDTGSSCCADEARESVAVSSVPVGVAAGWATEAVIAVTALPIPSFAAASAPPRAAPLILRI
jgi:hypothetical protein